MEAASDFASVMQDLRAALRAPRSRAQTLPDAPAETIALLSVIPSLPEEVAAAGIPGPEGRQLAGSDATELLRVLAEDGWVDSAAAALPRPGHSYRKSPKQRRLALNWLTTRKLGAPIYAIAFDALVRRQPQAWKPLPPALAVWQRLVGTGSSAQPGSPDQIAFLIDEAMDNALSGARRLHLDTSSDAETLLDAAEPLAAVMGGPVRVAAARGHRALELYQRRSADIKVLADYLDRDDLDNALKILVSQDQYWALHYLGVGGTGKTMFLRHLDAQLSRDLNLCTARVDFDHLNPNYPLRLPGLLLLGFAEEMRLSAPEAAVDSFRKLQVAVNEVHHALEEAQKSGREVKLGFDAPGFGEAMQRFIEGLTRIHESGKRPVLVLDTCEELARITPGRGLPRTVEETFRILEAIHNGWGSYAGCKEVRIVFSGRRPLANAGPGWAMPSVDMPYRDYLMLCPIAGFTEDESQRFLSAYGRRSEPPRAVPARHHKDILTLSEETEIGILNRIHSVPVAGAFDLSASMELTAVRHNPYDIDLFARWAASRDSDFSADNLGSKRHYYVRERIVARVREDLARCLPGLAALGRFDEELTNELAGNEGFDSLWAEIRRQEWVDVDRGTAAVPDSAPLTFWNIDRRMRDRLTAYYAEESPDEWRAARKRLAGILPGWTLNRAWDLLSPSYFAVCVRLLGEEPLAAAEWWAKVERRILNDQAWDWADKITAELLSPEAPKLRLGDAPHPLEACIYALRANVVMRQSPEADTLGELWQRVSQSLDGYPSAPGRFLLHIRAAAGMIAEVRYRAEPPESRHLTQVESSLTEISGRLSRADQGQAGSPQVDWCVCAALENAAEAIDLSRRGGQVGGTRPLPQAEDLARAITGGGLGPYARSCAHRIMYYCGAPPDYERWSDRCELSGEAQFDWIPPRDLFARQMLEWGRIFESDKIDEIREYRMMSVTHGEAPGNPDMDRFLSEALRLTGPGERSRDDLKAWMAASLAIANEREECQAHKVVPPAWATIIQTLADQGYVDEAVNALNEARAGRTSDSFVRWLNGASAYINRRFRLAEPAAGAFELPAIPFEIGDEVSLFLDFAQTALDQVGKRRADRIQVEPIREAAQHLAERLGFAAPVTAADLPGVPTCWRPWFARYVLIVQETAAKPNEKEKTAARNALAALYPSGQAPPDIASALKPRATRTWLYLSIGFVLIAALLWGLEFLTGKVFTAIMGYPVAWYWNLALLAAIAGGGAMTPRLLRWYFHLLSAVITGTYAVQRPSEPAGPIPVTYQTHILGLAPGKPFIRRMPSDPADAPYSVQAQGLAPDKPAGSSRWLREMLNWRISRWFELQLTLTIEGSEEASRCWEALIAMAALNSDTISTPFLFRRTTPDSQRAAPPFEGQMTLTKISGASVLPFPAKAVTGRESPLTALPGYPTPDAGILIFEAEVSIVHGEIRFITGNSACTVNDIARQFPQLRLCILVEPERGEVTARTPLDRLSASRARTAAHELYANGIPAVITIPALPVRGELLGRVLKILAEEATPSSNVSRALQIAVREARDLIFKEAGMPAADAAELAYDLCCYAADVVDLKSHPRPDRKDPDVAKYKGRVRA